MAVSFDIDELTALRDMAHRYPTAGHAMAEAAVLRAALSLPKETVHVVSDVHGEYKKLRHVINNASGSLRPLVSSIFEGRLSEEGQRELLSVLYYPREAMEHLRPGMADASFRREWVRRTLRLQFEVVRALARNYRREHVRSLFPAEALEICEELLAEPTSHRGQEYVNLMTDALAEHGILASVGSVGDALDNAMAESFVDSFKTELIADRVWRSRSQLELAIVEYVAWFNTARLHEPLGDLPPAEFEAGYALQDRRSHQYPGKFSLVGTHVIRSS